MPGLAPVRSRLTGRRRGVDGVERRMSGGTAAMEHFSHIPDSNLKAPSQPQPTELDKSWVLSRVEMILAGYRKADYQNPDAFMTQAAMNLMRFPKEVIEYVSAPTTGIQTRSKWPPSLAEIVEACIAEQAWCEKVSRYSAMGPKAMKALPPPRFSAEDSYERMFAKYGRPTGVFENVNDKWNNRRGA